MFFNLLQPIPFQSVGLILGVVIAAYLWKFPHNKTNNSPLNWACNM